MSLTLHYHPLASFCWKVLIALYENDTPFDAGDRRSRRRTSRAAFLKLWPIGQVPGARTGARPAGPGIDDHHRLSGAAPSRPRRGSCPTTRPGPCRPVSSTSSTTITSTSRCRRSSPTRIRPEGRHDPFGVEQARALCDRLRHGRARTWRQDAGRWAKPSRIADCAASPALFYANKVAPFTEHAPEPRRAISKRLSAAALGRARARGSAALHADASRTTSRRRRDAMLHDPAQLDLMFQALADPAAAGWSSACRAGRPPSASWPSRSTCRCRQSCSICICWRRAG